MTFTMTRSQFATYLRAYRAARRIRAYGRFGAFGRTFITFDGLHVSCPDYTRKPHLNLHWEGGR